MDAGFTAWWPTCLHGATLWTGLCLREPKPSSVPEFKTHGYVCSVNWYANTCEPKRDKTASTLCHTSTLLYSAKPVQSSST